MNTALRVLACLIIFFAGYTLGQGHQPFDYNGDKVVNRRDVTDLSDRIFRRP